MDFGFFLVFWISFLFSLDFLDFLTFVLDFGFFEIFWTILDFLCIFLVFWDIFRSY